MRANFREFSLGVLAKGGEFRHSKSHIINGEEVFLSEYKTILYDSEGNSQSGPSCLDRWELWDDGFLVRTYNRNGGVYTAVYKLKE